MVRDYVEAIVLCKRHGGQRWPFNVFKGASKWMCFSVRSRKATLKANFCHIISSVVLAPLWIKSQYIIWIALAQPFREREIVLSAEHVILDGFTWCSLPNEHCRWRSDLYDWTNSSIIRCKSINHADDRQFWIGKNYPVIDVDCLHK